MGLIIMIVVLVAIGFVFPPAWALAAVLAGIAVFKPSLFNRQRARPGSGLDGWNDK